MLLRISLVIVILAALAVGVLNFVMVKAKIETVEQHRDTEEKAKHVGSHVPIGRIGVADDIGGATLYLCSRAGSYVTGAILPIDGGQSVQHGLTLFKE